MMNLFESELRGVLPFPRHPVGKFGGWLSGLLVTALVGGCQVRGVTESKGPVSRSLSPTARYSDFVVPARRCFDMAMTPWPYDFTPQGIQETYEILDQHTDMVAHHFDGGVPWPEAFSRGRYPKRVQENLEFRANQLPGKKIYLAVTPIALLRDQLANYWGKNENMKRPRKWRKKSFSDPDVIRAYLNHCQTTIEMFHPAYFVYGVEVNLLEEKNPSAFPDYVAMTSEIYPRLKEAYPDLPLILSFHVGTYVKSPSSQYRAIRELLPYTDYLAVSSYPYAATRGTDANWPYADPAAIPANWFKQLRALAPKKPFAVAETGFLAEDFVSKQYGIAIPGTEPWQADYVKWLLKEANHLDARFVVWFVPRDYDSLWNRLERRGFDDLFKLWRDTGLQDGTGRGRPALQVWDAWLNLPRSEIGAP